MSLTQDDPELVIREVTPGIITFSRPFARAGLIPFGGRSTAVKTSVGSWLVVASTPCTPATQQRLQGASVDYLVAPDALHWLFLSEWAKAYPSAKIFGCKGVEGKKDWSKEGINFSGIWGRDHDFWPAELQSEFKSEYFKGHANSEVGLLHVPTRTLIEADLLFNLPAKEQYSKAPGKNPKPWYLPGALVFSALNPNHKKLVNKLTTDKAAMKASATVVASWDFDRIIPCHGDVIETEGSKAWKTAYGDVLKS